MRSRRIKTGEKIRAESSTESFILVHRTKKRDLKRSSPLKKHKRGTRTSSRSEFWVICKVINSAPRVVGDTIRHKGMPGRTHDKPPPTKKNKNKNKKKPKRNQNKNKNKFINHSPEH
jgi:hypothetical protein